MRVGGVKVGILFLYISVLPITARILRTPCISQAKFSYKRSDTRLHAAVIAKYNNKERVECESACLMEPRCKSVNTKGSDCELNNKTITDFTDNCTESGSAIPPSDGNCTLVQDSGWTFESTNYSNPWLGFNCNRNKPCGEEDLCLDTCICPGYECIHCSKVDNFPCPDKCKGVDCQNGGTCVEQSSGYKCNCAERFTGQHCEHQIDYCKGVYCKNGGSCANLLTTFRCNCVGGYTGTLCGQIVPG